jgi:hypothetical protein
MAKIDFKKELKSFYRASAREVAIIDLPQWNFLQVDGSGNPNTTPAFEAAIEALYSLSYTLKFMVKKGANGLDYGVLPLEGLWWSEEMESFVKGDKDKWNWTLMIMQPDCISPELVEEATEKVRGKKELPALSRVRFESYAEGKAAQVLHVGPYSEEGPTIERLHYFIEESGYKRRGKHHEIYLGDPRRAAPEKLKTILRQPIS